MQSVRRSVASPSALHNSSQESGWGDAYESQTNVQICPGGCLRTTRVLSSQESDLNMFMLLVIVTTTDVTSPTSSWSLSSKSSDCPDSKEFENVDLETSFCAPVETTSPSLQQVCGQAHARRLSQVLPTLFTSTHSASPSLIYSSASASQTASRSLVCDVCGV